jgi:hypothetical protein
MSQQLIRICIAAALVTIHASASFGQFPESVICQMERIATVNVDDNGRLGSSSEKSSGDIVISNLNSRSPMASGNIGGVRLQVLKKAKDTLWLAEITDDEVASVLTLFFKTGIVMFTKHETLVDKPFGLVEIGKCRAPK